MRRGRSPEQACREALERIVRWTRDNPDFDVKYVALRRDGEAACVGMRGRKSKPPEASIQTASGFRVIAGSYLYEQPETTKK
jgi:D-arabinose 1-dehydrogenase-like Zn-dependent alcohol dehydrogenase